MTISPRDQFDFLTARITATKRKGTTQGTGFFCQFSVGDGMMTCFITNRHILEDATQISLVLRSVQNGVVSQTHFLNAHFDMQPGGPIFHSNPNIDLACFNVSTMDAQFQDRDRKPFYVPITETSTADEALIASTGSMQPVMTIGYPLGPNDVVNNTPFFRSGITATSPARGFNGKPEFVIDSPVLGGSSGSPVLLYDAGISVDEYFNTSLGTTRILLLGIVRAVFVNDRQGRMVEANCDAVPHTTPPVGLGICISATELKDLKRQIIARVAH
jgi:hypothetical protein